MDIYEKLNDRYAELATAGYGLENSIRNSIVAEYQSRWDNGERFTGRYDPRRKERGQRRRGAYRLRG